MAAAATSTLPTLENGDSLTCEEFWHIYRQRHDIRKAEHIDGIVYVPSPVNHDSHAYPHAILGGWLGTYAAPLRLPFGDNGSILLPNRQTVQPDLYLLAADTAMIHASDHLEGVPDLVIEVASSSASYDLHVKQNLYERVDVQEYLVWRTRDAAIDWFRLAEGTYQRAEPVNGHIESHLFPGLILDVEALLAGDYADVLRQVRAPAATDPHETPPA